jgi:hypothetical protein
MAIAWKNETQIQRQTVLVSPSFLKYKCTVFIFSGIESKINLTLLFYL